MSRNNSAIGSIIGLLVFLGFGVFFLFGGGAFRIFSFVPFFPMIIIFVIIGIIRAVSAASKHSTGYSSNSNNQYSSQVIPKSNPYVVKPTVDTPVRQIYVADVEPEVSKTNYCQYCGTKKDRNAVYCHNCGTRL